MARAMIWTMHGLQRMMCGLRGHDAVLHFERHRLSLRCLNCGHQTAGWVVESETRRAEPLTDDFSHSHTSGFRRLHRIVEVIIGVSLARRLSRSGHATT